MLSNSVKLGKRVGKGGSKNIHDIENDYVIALPNGQSLGTWKRMVKEEVNMATKVRQAGLMTQQYEKTMVAIEGEPTLVIKMPSFTALLKKGIQVRDAKRPPEVKFLTRKAIGIIFSAVTNDEIIQLGLKVNNVCLLDLRDIAEIALHKIIPEIEDEITHGVITILKSSILKNNSHTLRRAKSINFDFFRKLEDDYLTEHRCDDSRLQHEYDRRFGLVIMANRN